MANWVYPLGSAADGKWDISLGTSDSSLAVDGWAHTGLKVATLAAGSAVELSAAVEERIVVPLSGSFTVTVDGEQYRLQGRQSVFHGPSDVLYTGIEKAVTISSNDGGRVAVATAPAKASYPTRLITAAETPVELRGAGNCSRQVHNFGTPAALEADRFIVCEVITPAGNWSSYPPHKHDEEKDGETSLEEIYYFETRVAPGSPAPEETDAIGYARVYASDERPIDVSAEVRTGDVVLVPYGWHGPAMAAPGYDLYYLNVMAGPGRVRDWLISDDPHHGWIRQTWDGQDVDPRLPFSA
ncbi:5-deoxy-glucuronate isomerase [Paenarthrobacter ureafaciens]|jgi:5-deoxy-glucuronate isomerase|uniref:5-deoxy-glucuronate isomerase n=1 Tax=Paenarthrobacter ureafaciens TaxID=37931 RepID=UPI00140BC738|nr:5-deoxy-glucuronate isomerase [Paenarthrobacter ureafaciens]MCX8454172.1 5-deoxy-glucuronate isomerase [Paenarthrobacter ureafaciens]MCY0972378.1 5-deoxy-glucuronate isomerase [Paenarthrobacter ureafaciens]QQQ63137.1 5-deoxy-glucuronate isomerase [Paenarthrobacter ureafaciens]